MSSSVLSRSLRSAWGLVLLGAGCGSVPQADQTVRPLPVAEGWVEYAAAKPVADSNWVDGFHNESLSNVVDKALAENRDLGRLTARIKSAEAEAVIAGAAGRPQVGATFDADRSQRNFIGFPGASAIGGATGQEDLVFSSLANTFNLNLNLRWELDLWGRVRAGHVATLEQLRASRSDYEAAKLSLAGQTAKAWFQMVAAQAHVDLAKEALEVFMETERAAESEFREGINRPGRDAGSELSLARVDVANARASLTAREQELPWLRRRIEVFMGLYPAGVLAGEGRLPEVPGTPPAGIPAELLERRPDLLAAEQRLAAADNRVLEAKRSLLPAISLTASYGTSAPELSQILEAQRIVWNLANNLTQPILDGKRLLQNVKAREADVEFALAEYEQAVLTAFQEVENALSLERFLREQERAVAESVRLAQDAMKRTRQAYADGVGDVLSMLNAQQRLINARSSLIDVKLRRLENRVDLHLALGGDFVGR